MMVRCYWCISILIIIPTIRCCSLTGPLCGWSAVVLSDRRYPSFVGFQASHFIKNWRPLTLLNCDYKIAAKAIANRIKTVIPKLINSDQTGFLKGRFIGENIRLIDSIIKYASESNIPGLLLFIDFEKAFDSVEWSFIERTLQYFGFGPSLTRWVKTFYKKIESCVLNNG